MSIAVEWGSDRTNVTINAKSNSFSRLAGNPAQGVVGGKMAHSLRSMGSAALNYAMVAQGGLDIYWLVLTSARLSKIWRHPLRQGNWVLALGCMCRHRHSPRSRWCCIRITFCLRTKSSKRRFWGCHRRNSHRKKIHCRPCHWRHTGKH